MTPPAVVPGTVPEKLPYRWYGRPAAAGPMLITRPFVPPSLALEQGGCRLATSPPELASTAAHAEAAVAPPLTELFSIDDAARNRVRIGEGAMVRASVPLSRDVTVT